MLHNTELARDAHAAFPIEARPFCRTGWLGVKPRVWRAALWAFGILALLAVLLTAAIAFVITRSVELPFLRNQVSAAVERALGDGYSATVGSATLDTDPVLGLVARLSDIVILDNDGTEVARLPTTLLAISPIAIVNSQNVVRTVEIDDAVFSVKRVAHIAIFGDGNTIPTPNVASPVTEEVAFPPGFDVLSNPVEALNSSLVEILGVAEAGFERIGIYNATIELWRDGDTAPHRFDRTDISIKAEPETGRLTATMTASGYSGRWSMSAERVPNASTGGTTLSLVFSQLTLADFFPAVGRDPSWIASNIPFYGRAVIGMDAEGRVESASARIDLGAGYFAFGLGANPILLNEATIRVSWDVPGQMMFVERSAFQFGPSGATIAGTVRPDGNGRFAFDLVSTDAVLAPTDSPAAPLFVDRIRLAGAVDLDAGLINFDRASISTPFGSLVAAGSIGLEGGSPSIALVATLSEMPISVFKQIWPPGLQDGGRSWTLESVTSGTVAGVLEAEIPAGVLARGDYTPEMVNLELLLADLDFNPAADFPAVVGATGRAVLSGSRFGVDLDGGTIFSPAGEALEITAATFVIGETTAVVPTARMELHAQGPTSAFGLIADQEPIRALEPYGVPPSALGGVGAALMSATWPMVEGLSFQEVEWRIALTLSDVSSAVAVQDMLITGGDVLLEITPDLIAVTGTAIVDGVAAELDLVFPQMAEIDGGQRMRMVLDEEARARLGFNLEGFLGGTVTALVTDLGADGPGQRYELDLLQARLIIAPLGWAKPVGVAATMSFDLVPTESGQRIRDLRVVGDGFGLAGEVDLDSDLGIVRAEITDFKLQRADSLSFVYQRDGNGWTVDADGEAFDVRGLLTSGFGEVDGAGDALDLRINGRFGTLVGFNGERIDDAEITFVSVGGAIELIEIIGTTNGAAVDATYRDNGGGAFLAVNAADAGAVLRFADIYSRGHGGVLTITGQEATDGALYGHVDMTGFVVTDEPALVRLMTPPAGTPVELATTIPFEDFEFDFAQRGTVLSVDEILLRGGDMGAIGAGWVDFAVGEIAIAGTYIPAYAFNNMFSRIPIIGLALGGGNREGLFGLTFQIAGQLDNPQMQINPLSAIAPGMFRKIFQFQ